MKLPRVVDQAWGLIKPVRERYVPITSAVQTDLLAIAHTVHGPDGRRDSSISI